MALWEIQRLCQQKWQQKTSGRSGFNSLSIFCEAWNLSIRSQFSLLKFCVRKRDYFSLPELMWLNFVLQFRYSVFQGLGFTNGQPAGSIWEVRKVQRGMRYAGLYLLFSGLTYFYTNIRFGFHLRSSFFYVYFEDESVLYLLRLFD
jgi:hypothetical protein